MSKIPIFSHTQASYSEAIFLRFGKGKHHAAKLYSNWFRKGNVSAYSHWAEPQAVALVEKIIEETDFSLSEMSALRGETETVKFLLKLSDGLETESVLIPMEAGATLCISSQIGCKMGCSFCETGKMGLIRHLHSKEIVQQVFSARFVLDRQVRNIVFMGMGEPFDNYDAVMHAIAILTESGGFGFGPSRITISTSGNVDAILRMAKEADPALNLAVSVNAPNDAIRNRIMPVNRKWNMAELKRGMLEYCSHPKREIFVEYVLLKGINDSLESADLLAVYLRGLRVKVNLIPYNPQTRDRYFPPDGVLQLEAFHSRMQAHGYQTFLRTTKGQKIMAACGQLGNIHLKSQPKVKADNLQLSAPCGAAALIVKGDMADVEEGGPAAANDQSIASKLRG